MLEAKDIKQSYVGGRWFLTSTVTFKGRDIMHVEFNGKLVSFYRCHSLDNILILSQEVPVDNSHDKVEQLACFNRFIPFMMRHAHAELDRQIQQMIN